MAARAAASHAPGAVPAAGAWHRRPAPRNQPPAARLPAPLIDKHVPDGVEHLRCAPQTERVCEVSDELRAPAAVENAQPLLLHGR
jgi:hypothetical protein